MKSYAERTESALAVILKALRAMDEGQVDGVLCYLSYENAATIERTLQNQKRRFKRSNTAEG